MRPCPLPTPRRYQRVPLSVEVSLESEHNFYSGVSNDISEGGLFIATFDPPLVGSMVELSLTLPGSPEVFTMMGIVRWIRDLKASCDGCPAGCGIEWVDLSERALRSIGRFVRERETILYEVG